MNRVQPLLRGPRASSVLASLGIDARRYWLLTDLFGELSERGEMLDQLGTNGVALRAVTWIYAAVCSLLGFVLVAGRPAPATYLATFAVLTAFLLLSVLLSEAGNSLVNPVEGLVLAHQPVNGATYTAAKLTHLARIILWLVTGMNAAPALTGLLLTGSAWFYPLVHFGSVLALGLLAGLLCCALYGWLMRLLPPRRLKAAGQLAGTVPVLAMIWWQPLRDLLARARIGSWLPVQAAARWALVLAFGAAGATIVMLGIRSLSADYLIRVSSIMHGGSTTRTGARRSWIGEIAARLFGGQPARAGFAFVSRMMRRDFQFRRQVLPTLLLGVLGVAPLIARNWRTDPFSGRFTTAHLLPHIFGFTLLFVCSLLPYGSDFKGAWFFLLAPAQAFGRFASGVYAALWIQVVVVPHAVLFLLFAWPWGTWHAGLYAGYSLAIASLYLALELRLIDSVPFSKQMDPARGSALLPLMMLGGLAMAVAVALQYFFVFRSAARVALVAVCAGIAAYLLTRRSLAAVESSMRYSLGLLSAESGSFYKEIDI